MHMWKDDETTKSSRRESGTTSQGPSFRTGSGKLASSMPVNRAKISGSMIKAVKLSIPSLGRHVTTQAPSTPSVSNNMLTLTNVTGRRKIQTAARIRVSPLPFSRPVPAMRSQPRIKGMSRRATTSRPSQGTRPLQERKNPHKLGGKHIKMHAPAKPGSTQPNRRSTNATTSSTHQTPQLFRQSQRGSASDPTIGNFSNSKLPTCTHVPFKRKASASKQSKGLTTRINAGMFSREQATPANHAT